MNNIKRLLPLLILLQILTPGLSFADHHGSDEEKYQFTIRNLKQLPDNLITGGQPNKADLKALSEQGIKTVINFRGKGEFQQFDEARVVADNGMTYLHLPIDSRDALNKKNVAKFREALDDNSGGTFLHCGSGNRVGALFALDAYWNQNKSAAEALAIGEAAGLTSLKGHVQSLLEVK